jgi:hypothetical protein
MNKIKKIIIKLINNLNNYSRIKKVNKLKIKIIQQNKLLKIKRNQ